MIAVLLGLLFWENAGVWQGVVIANKTTALQNNWWWKSDFAVSADERYLAINADHKVAIYDRIARKTLLSIPSISDLRQLFFSRDGKVLLTRDQNEVLRLYDVFTGKKRLEMQGKGDSSAQDEGELSPDGSILVANALSGIELWNTNTGCKIASLNGPAIRIASASRWYGRPLFITSDSRYIVAGVGYDFMRFNASDGTFVDDVPLPDEEANQFLLRTNRNGTTMAYIDWVSPFPVHVIDRQTGKDRFAPVNSGPTTYYLQVTHDQKGILVGEQPGPRGNCRLTYIDSATGATTSSAACQQFGPWFEESPDSRFLACHDLLGGTVILDTRSLRTLADLPGQFESEQTPFSSEGRRLFLRVGDGNDLAIYDTATWKLLSTLRPGKNTGDVRYISDNTILTIEDDRKLLSWTRRRPEAWYGVAVLWQFWAALIAAGGFLSFAIRDLKRWYHPTLADVVDQTCSTHG